MPSRFQLYMTSINDLPAWIEVDLSVSDEMNRSSYPYLFCVHVAMREPDPEGFPKLNELILLDAYEHTLISALERHAHSKCVGRISMDGIRQLYFYAADSTIQPVEIINKLWDDQPAFETQATDVEEDEQWQYYDELLLPNAEERQQMVNRQRVEQLKSSGDLLLASRRISHWFAFQTAEQRQTFIDLLVDIRYEVGVCPELSEDNGYSLEMIRSDLPNLESISDVTAYLMEAVTTYHGTYLGWETEAVIG